MNLMNIFFWPTFQTFCPVGVQIAQTVVNLPTFKFSPGNGVFWGELWGVLCTYIAATNRFVAAE